MDVRIGRCAVDVPYRIEPTKVPTKLPFSTFMIQRCIREGVFLQRWGQKQGTGLRDLCGRVGYKSAGETD